MTLNCMFPKTIVLSQKSDHANELTVRSATWAPGLFLMEMSKSPDTRELHGYTSF